MFPGHPMGIPRAGFHGSISQLGGVPGPHAQKPVSHSELEAFYQKFAPDSNGKRHSVADILKTYKHNRDGLNVALQQRYGRSLKDLEQAPHPKPPAQRPPVQKYPAEKSLKAPAARPPMVPARPTTSPALPKTSPVRPEKAPVAAATPPKEQYNPESFERIPVDRVFQSTPRAAPEKELNGLNGVDAIDDRKFTKRLEEAKAQTGAVHVCLMWDNSKEQQNDLDLIVECSGSSNGKIYAGNPSVGRGRLDVARDTADVDCVENIFWTTPESGSFKVLVNNHMGPRAHYTVMLHAISPVKLMSKRGHILHEKFVGKTFFRNDCGLGETHPVFTFMIDS